MAAFRDKWKPPVSTVKPKAAKAREPRQPEPDPRVTMSAEEQQTHRAMREREKAQLAEVLKGIS
jgi:hypothetical protein